MAESEENVTLDAPGKPSPAPEDRPNHDRSPKNSLFFSGGGLWQFSVMAFGLCNATATFEQLMEKVLNSLSWKMCLVYLDDIIVFAKTFNVHLTNL